MPFLGRREGEAGCAHENNAPQTTADGGPQADDCQTGKERQMREIPDELRKTEDREIAPRQQREKYRSDRICRQDHQSPGHRRNYLLASR